jgi:hypothetical protein
MTSEQAAELVPLNDRAKSAAEEKAGKEPAAEAATSQKKCLVTGYKSTASITSVSGFFNHLQSRVHGMSSEGKILGRKHFSQGNGKAAHSQEQDI